MGMIVGQRTRQALGRRVRCLRCVAVDNSDQQALGLWKGAVQSHRVLAPGQAGSEHLVGVGVDTEMPAGIKAGRSSQQQADEYHAPRVPAAAVHQSDQRALQQRCLVGHGTDGAFRHHCIPSPHGPRLTPDRIRRRGAQ